jgi:hypothetical protein
MSDLTSFTVVRRRPEHVNQINELYAGIFGQDSLEQSLKRWDWQYLENPSVGESEPAIWVAVQGELVLGQLATMEFSMWWGQQEVRASAAMDYMVRESARGRGVGIALADTWLEDVDVGLGLGLTPSSHALFRKSMTDVGPVSSYLKVLDVRKCARRRWGSFLGTVATPFVKLVLGLAPTPVSGISEIEVCPVSYFSKEYDGLWVRVRNSYAAIVKRDSDYLNWRYIQCPFRSYCVHEARVKGVLTGYAVTRTEGKRDFLRGIIVDLFCDANDVATQRVLIDAALNSFRRDGGARAETYCFDVRLARAFQQHGFRRGRTSMQYTVSHRGVSSEPLTRQSEWSLTLGDGDLDRA